MVRVREDGLIRTRSGPEVDVIGGCWIGIKSSLWPVPVSTPEDEQVPWAQAKPDLIRQSHT